MTATTESRWPTSSNVAAFLVHVVDLADPAPIYNCADKPDLSMTELVTMASSLLGRPVPKLRLPYGLGLVAGRVFDTAAAVTGKQLPISAVRVEKFCANTQIDTARAERTGFAPAYSLMDGLERTIRSEFLPPVP